MGQFIGAMLVFFGVFPLSIWGLTKLLNLSGSRLTSIALAGCAYCTAFLLYVAGYSLYKFLPNGEAFEKIGAVLGFVFLCALNSVAARVLYPSTAVKAAAIGAVTTVLFSLTSIGSLVILLWGVSFC